MERTDIRDYIDQSQALIESSPQMDEQNTRRKLVEPLLELLGWEMLSPNVELEYSVQMGAGTKKVDYALVLEETPVVFVETKGLDSSIRDSHRRQLKSYMRQTGVDWGLLTNGESFEILKRRTEGRRPDEVSLGKFTLDTLDEHVEILQALSREMIDSGEADTIAHNIEQRRIAANTLRDEKEGIAQEISEVVIQHVGEAFSQPVQSGAKEYVDYLISTLEQREGDPTVFERDPDKPTTSVSRKQQRTAPLGNAISGSISRRQISGDSEDSVVVFPTKKSGLDFLKENNAWGFVRMGREPDYAAMYVSEDVQEIKYVAKIKEVVPANEADLAREYEFYSEFASDEEQAGFDPGKNVVVFEEGTLKELEDPIPFESKWPQSHRYTTLGKLRDAETTDDVL